ncbi:MAG: ribbon-helix-helix domain-containing protein [Candidatus Bathyarchaeia archaeon]
MEKVVIEVVVPKKLYEEIKALIERGKYATISEAVRDGLRAITSQS